MDEREELHDKTLLLLARLSECSSLNCSAKKKGQQISKEKAREKKEKQGHLCLGVHERKNEKSWWRNGRLQDSTFQLQSLTHHHMCVLYCLFGYDLYRKARSTENTISICLEYLLFYILYSYHTFFLSSFKCCSHRLAMFLSLSNLSFSHSLPTCKTFSLIFFHPPTLFALQKNEQMNRPYSNSLIFFSHHALAYHVCGWIEDY